jgi:hypothetical protein
MRRVRAKLLPALLLGALTLALAAPTPSLAAARRSRAGAAARRGPSVTAALQSLQRSGQITPALYRQYASAYAAAQHSLGRLSGTRRTELGAVLANVQAMAASGYFIASRLPVIFLTLERNRQWWTTEPLLASGTRVSFPRSKIVWEYYGGQGIEIQWLGTFGAANGFYLSGHENANLRQLLGEVLALASKRAGGIAWEYMFQFDGGRPPWTSGLSQGTALQVLARSWSRFKEPALLSAAQQAVGVFQTSPPAGVQVKTSAGSEYAEYTYAPSDRILNGFVQAVVGLYDYTQITRDPLGLQLFEAGDAEARAALRHRRLVAVRPVLGIEPQLPRTAHRIPAAPVRTHPQRTAADERAAAAHDHDNDDRAAAAIDDDDAAGGALRRHLAGHRRVGRGGAWLAEQRADADRRRSGLLHDGAALHDVRQDATGDLAADEDAEGRHARRRAAVAVEGLERAPFRASRLAHGLDEQRVPGTRQAAPAVDDAIEGRDVQRHAQRKRSGGQLLDGDRHDRRRSRLRRSRRSERA